MAVFAVGASLVVGTTHHSAREAGRRSPCGTSANVPSVFHMRPPIEIKTRSASRPCLGFLFQICYTRSSSVTGESINQMDGNAHLKGRGRVSLKVPMEVISKVHITIRFHLLLLFLNLFLYSFPPFSCGGKKRSGMRPEK